MKLSYGSVVHNMFTKSFLRGVRCEALRKRVWYRVLDGVERGIFNLTIGIVDSVESAVLGSVLVGFIVRLREAMKGGFVKVVESVGCERAVRFAGLARGWGYGDVPGIKQPSKFVQILKTTAPDEVTTYVKVPYHIRGGKPTVGLGTPLEGQSSSRLRRKRNSS